jgi:hypothetical protein
MDKCSPVLLPPWLQLDIGEIDIKVLRTLVLAARQKIKTLDKVGLSDRALVLMLMCHPLGF